MLHQVQRFGGALARRWADARKTPCSPLRLRTNGRSDGNGSRTARFAWYSIRVMGRLSRGGNKGLKTDSLPRHIVRAAIALGALVATASCSGRTSTNQYPCSNDADCAAYGKYVGCQKGTCWGSGIGCSEHIGIDGRAPTAGPGSPTVAATFEEMISVANTLWGTYCDQSNACLNTPQSAACVENEPDTYATCCKSALDFYVAHRSEVSACSSAKVPCSTPSVAAFCGPFLMLVGCEKG
jgi:hypothetical protein